jgi:hypothetical protein
VCEGHWLLIASALHASAATLVREEIFDWVLVIAVGGACLMWRGQIDAGRG